MLKNAKKSRFLSFPKIAPILRGTTSPSGEIFRNHRAETQGRRDMIENEIGTMVVECAIAVHRETGPGLLESVYESILARELELQGLDVKRQVPIPIRYKDMIFDEGFRADIVINDSVILELKSVEKVTAAHKKQTQTYLRLTGCRLGYLLNFGEALMKNGITRCVNGLPE